MLFSVAGTIPTMFRQKIAKEFTEYSSAELNELMAGRPVEPSPHLSSDDFESAAGAVSAVATSSAALLGMTQPLCKEFSEFSEHELAAVMLNTAAVIFQRSTSDDYKSTDISDGEREADEADTDAETPVALEKACRCLIPFCKEHTEYSQQELEELAPTGPLADGHRAAVASSDDFCCCAEGHLMALVRSLPRSSNDRPMCKELTEYSSNELSLILDEGHKPSDEQQQPSDTKARTSDDFLQPASTFASFYHRNCMTGTGEHIQKRVRRVYHNRRKTAWTDYDEDGKVIKDEVEPSSEAADAATASEPAEVPALVRLLKGEGGNAVVAPTREKVREVAQQEAKDRRVSLQKVVEATGPCGWTPLLIAVQRKQTAAVTALLELGANIECEEPSCGWTPLMYAAQTGKRELVAQLLAKGSNVNACSVRHKWSPLCSAIQSGNEEVVHMLLAAGACLQAVKKQHPAVADIYRQEMAQYQGPPAAKAPAVGCKAYSTDYSQSC